MHAHNDTFIALTSKTRKNPVRTAIFGDPGSTGPTADSVRASVQIVRLRLDNMGVGSGAVLHQDLPVVQRQIRRSASMTPVGRSLSDCAVTIDMRGIGGDVLLGHLSLAHVELFVATRFRVHPGHRAPRGVCSYSVACELLAKVAWSLAWLDPKTRQ